MMLRLAILLGAAALSAEPLVTGFERFHAAKPTAEGGRLLYNELGCVNCHGGATGLPALRGPALATVNQRVRSEWLRKFIADPESVHPGTVMPQVLAKADAKTETKTDAPSGDSAKSSEASSTSAPTPSAPAAAATPASTPTPSTPASSS